LLRKKLVGSKSNVESLLQLLLNLQLRILEIAESFEKLLLSTGPAQIHFSGFPEKN
jgi:hypothetical protein